MPDQAQLGALVQDHSQLCYRLFVPRGIPIRPTKFSSMNALSANALSAKVSWIGSGHRAESRLIRARAATPYGAPINA